MSYTMKAKFARPFFKIGVSLAFRLGRLAMLLPAARRRILKKFAYVNRMEVDEVAETLFSKEMKETVVKCHLLYLMKEVKIGHQVPDNPIIKQGDRGGDNYQQLNFKDIQRAGVPLVLNFGSNSWPPFVADSKSFSELKQQYGEHIDFAFVYIQEAHPTGEWEFKVTIYMFFYLLIQNTMKSHYTKTVSTTFIRLFKILHAFVPDSNFSMLHTKLLRKVSGLLH